MSVARRDHTATLLPNGKVLVAGGASTIGNSTLQSTELYDTATGIFSPAANLREPRQAATATLLPDGRVLLAGGIKSGGYAGAEIYNPSSGIFSATGAMTSLRWNHTATLLPNGKVLLIGGTQSGPAFSSAELYDPVAGTFASTGSLGIPRVNHTATLLPDGKVLVAGGASALNGSGLASAELYDPNTDTFAPTGSMKIGRTYHSATRLNTGKVLMIGAAFGGDTSAELYDPATGTFSSTGNTTIDRPYASATLLTNGQVLIAGGAGASFPRTGELYASATGTFALAATMANGRYLHTATLLPNGQVLLVGGYNRNSGSSVIIPDAELYLGPTNVISGTVTFVGGVGNSSGLYGVTISDGTHTSLTDGKGNYVMTDVPAGNVSFSATRSGYYFTPDPLTITIGSSRTGVNFTAYLPNAAPTLNPIYGPQTVKEDSQVQMVSLSGITAGGETQKLTVSATSSNPSLIPDPVISYTANSSDGSLAYQPSANQFGSTIITVSIKDDGGTGHGGVDTFTRAFTVNVTSVNDAPSFTQGNTVTVNENSGAYTAPWATNIAAGPANETGQKLSFHLSTDNPALFSEAPTLSPGGVLSFTPALNANGSALVTAQLQDDGGTDNGGLDSFTRSFTLQVNAVNDAPTITVIPDTTIDEDTTSGPLPFTVSDVETSASDLNVSASSSDTTVVALNSLALGGSGSQRNLTVTPQPNAFGTTTITLTVTDGDGQSAATSFTVTVIGQNDVPTITSIGDQSTSEDTATDALPFIVGDTETSASDLQVTASSSNTSIVATTGITLGGSGANRTVRLTPSPDASGQTAITLTVRDGDGFNSSTSFLLTVGGQNDVPTISPIAAQSTSEDMPFGPLSFRVSDTETSADALQVSVASSNTVLIPNSALVLGGSGSERTLSLMPTPNAFGQTTITLGVRDTEGASTTSSFVLSVTPVNDAPVAQDQNLSGAIGQDINFVLGATDVDGDALTYEIASFSGDGTLGGGRLSGTAPNLTFTSFTPGTYSLTFRDRDAAGATSELATVTFTIGQVSGLTLSGQVISSEPNASYSASISVSMRNALVRLESGGQVVAQTATDSAGRYTFFGVATNAVTTKDAQVRVVAIDPQGTRQPQSLPFALSQLLKLKVSKKQPLPTQVTVAPFVLYSIWGQVNAKSADKKIETLTPVAGASVQLSKSASATYTAVNVGTTTNANGFYVFKYLGRARFGVAAQAPGVTFAKSGAGVTLPGTKRPFAPSARFDIVGTRGASAKAASPSAPSS